ncbi:hypothetical protein CK203_107868 [Vitis vinifera]|uniref:Uncharacterized protein n=1 Tax=Vitis vinifera TaxID=29760 RepID=A0A438CIA8_VITVI|nr:hypothetical protein CK203_107868 [Vitis vinifera]
MWRPLTSPPPEPSICCTPPKKARTSGPRELFRHSQPDPRTLPILSFLPASHRKPSSRGLWSPCHPLRAIQIVEPDHSIPSFILTSRPYDIGWSYGIHLDYSRGIISSAL